MTAVAAEKPKIGARNCSIDIIRCAASLLVVANHSTMLKDYDLPILSTVLESLVPFVLPFFFMVAGYYFVCGLMSGKKMLGPLLKKMLLPYAVWSVVYLLIDFFKYGRGDAVGYLKSCVFRFFIGGTAYHLWYFPAVMVSAIIVTIFFRLHIEKLLPPVSFLAYAVLVLGTYYYQFFILKYPAPSTALSLLVQKNPALSRMLLIGFPFFCEGYCVKILMDRNGFVRRNCTALTIVFSVLFVGEYMLVYQLDCIPTNIFGHYFVTLPFMLTLLEHPMADRKEAAERCRVFAGHTYYAHPLYLIAVEAAYSALFGKPIPSLLRFAAAVLLCFLISKLAMKIKNKTIRAVVC